ncbi:hypothetical protein [Candidatus Poriferisocius sp.]|uniref:hypothetical protein n=1 Tax=Candidatus Poriferisocius sp. TaxID=3101276 RepID=UPI003B0161C3
MYLAIGSGHTEKVRNFNLLRRLLLGAAALVGIAAILLALFLADTDDIDVTISGNAAVDALIPPRNAEVLSQETVGVDLATGYDARLALNGVNIPPEQVRHMPNINRFTFRPDEGKVIERLQAERNCVEVTYWPLAAGPEQADTISWCFNAS